MTDAGVFCTDSGSAQINLTAESISDEHNRVFFTAPEALTFAKDEQATVDDDGLEKGNLIRVWRTPHLPLLPTPS